MLTSLPLKGTLHHTFTGATLAALALPAAPAAGSGTRHTPIYQSPSQETVAWSVQRKHDSMSTPRRGMQRAAVRGRARAAHQGRAAQHGHARIWSWRVWYLHICNTGEVRSLQPMPVPRGVRFATYNRCPNKHKASCEIRSATRSRVHTCNAALSDASPSSLTSRV